MYDSGKATKMALSCIFDQVARVYKHTIYTLCYEDEFCCTITGIISRKKQQARRRKDNRIRKGKVQEACLERKIATARTQQGTTKTDEKKR
jgi:hypothetical protein